jgi:hypothetical protein
MKEINHENLNSFVGACVEAPNICILTKYCTKRSLQVMYCGPLHLLCIGFLPKDVIQNDDIKLDLNFKNSFISDIINVRNKYTDEVVYNSGRFAGNGFLAQVCIEGPRKAEVLQLCPGWSMGCQGDRLGIG